jgi:pimeloyl-ACP methyl ester carboxylesterase
MGGVQATRFAFLYPERTTHLVMVNPVGLSDNRYGRGFEAFDGDINLEPDLQDAWEGDVRTEMNRYVVWKPEFLEHLRIRHGLRMSAEWPRLAMSRAMSGHFWGIDSTVDDWPRIATKAMVMGGEEDGPNFPEQARRAAEALPNAELVLIPNAGHNPHEEVPEIVNAELIRFLSSDPATPAAEDASGGE